MIKMMYFIRRNPALSPAEFHHHWKHHHARLILETPSVSRHMLGYQRNPRALSDYERGEPDYDGVAVAWHRDLQSVHAIFEEPEYRNKIQPDETYLADMSRVSWILCDTENNVILADELLDTYLRR